MSTVERTLHNAAAAEGNGESLYVRGLVTAVITLTLTGTAVVTFEAQQIVDGDWTAVSATNITSSDEAPTASASGGYRVNVSAFYALRARISSYTDGEVTAVGTGTSINISTDHIDDTTAAHDDSAIAAAASAVNYTVATPDVRAHLAGIDTALGSAVPKIAGVNAQTMAYEIVAGDSAKIITCDGTFAINLPDGLTQYFQVAIANIGTGTISFTADTTIVSKDSAVTLATQYTMATAVHLGSNVWLLVGDLE